MAEEAQMVVEIDLPCIGCAYSLRMQPRDGRCPECGAAVRCTWEETALRWGARYLQRQARSAAWLGATALAMPAIYLIASGVQMVLQYAHVYRHDIWLPVTAFSLWAAVMFLHAVAAWVSTESCGGEKLADAAWLIRLGAGFAALAMVFPLAEIVMEEWPAAVPIRMEFTRYAMLIFPFLGLVLPLHVWLSGRRFALVARRASMAGIGKWGRVWGGVFLGGFVPLNLILCGLAVQSFNGRRFPQGDALTFTILGALLLGLVGIVGESVMLIQFARQMWTFAKRAEEAVFTQALRNSEQTNETPLDAAENGG